MRFTAERYHDDYHRRLFSISVTLTSTLPFIAHAIQEEDSRYRVPPDRSGGWFLLLAALLHRSLGLSLYAQALTGDPGDVPPLAQVLIPRARMFKAPTTSALFS